MRLVYVLLYDITTALVNRIVDTVLLSETAVENVVWRFRKENSLSLRQAVWFHDIGGSDFVSLVLCVMTPQVERLTWQNPSLGVELELVWKEFLESSQVSCQMVLTCDAQDTWIHVHFLPRVKLRQKVWANREVVPGEIKHYREPLVRLPIPNRSFMIFFKIHQPPV